MRFPCWLVFAATVVTACSQTEPSVRVISPLPRGKEPAMYLTAARYKAEIDHALRAAGFQMTDVQTDGSYLLRVTVGMDQSSQPCGTLNNVRYSVRAAGRELIEAVAKGWTGKCEPNVFDSASRELRA